MKQKFKRICEIVFDSELLSILFKLVFWGLLLYFSLNVLNSSVSSDKSVEPVVLEDSNYFIRFYTDQETGVQYIIYREKFYNAGFGGITPRLNSDGSLYLDDIE